MLTFIDFGEPVDIGGLKITPGDLLHCDLHGVQTVPARIAGELPETVARMQAREAELIRFCASQGFSIEKLDRMLKRERSSCQPASRF
jgi:regulator of RNase E activity RraA